MYRFSRTNGFSLIELLVVLVIVGSIMTLVTVNMEFLVPSSRLNAAASALASTVVLAHSRAALSGSDVIVSYDLNQQIYQIILLKDGKPDPMTAREFPTGVKYLDIEVAGENKKTQGIFQVYISPIGVVRAHIVHLKNTDGQIMSIEINPLSGDVDVSDGYQEMNFIEKL